MARQSFAPSTVSILRIVVCALTASSVFQAHATDLLDVYQSALGNDPQYLAISAANRAAQELRPQALSSLLPDARVSVSTTGTRQDVRESTSTQAEGVSKFNDRGYNLNITQPLLRRDRWIQLDQADTSIEQSNVEFAFARQDLIVRAAERYFDVLRALDELEFARAQEESNRQQLNQAQQRFQVGLIAITDVREAQAGFDSSRAQVIAAENQVDNAREALREVTGEYYDVVDALGEAIPLIVPEPNNIDRWTETALEQNLELSARRLAAERASQEIRRVKAGHLPTIDLVGEHGYSSSGGSTFGSGSSKARQSTISLQLAVPIYQGGLVLSQTREALHLYQQTLDEQETQRRAAQRQTRDAFLGIISGISRIQALDATVTSTKSALEAIEAGFEVGTRTSVDVLDAEQALFQSQTDYSAARYDYVLDLLRLKQAAGTLSDEDIAAVNKWLVEARDVPQSPTGTSAQTTSATGVGAAASGAACFGVGPFASEDAMAPVARWFEDQGIQTQMRTPGGGGDLGYIVYLPPFESRVAAYQEQERLTQIGIIDVAVLPRGDLENGISLGVYDNEAPARRRQSQLSDMGIDAQLRSRDDGSYSLEVVVDEGEVINDTAFGDAYPDLSLTPTDCG